MQWARLALLHAVWGLLGRLEGSPGSGSWCHLLAGEVSGAVGRVLARSLVAGSKGKRPGSTRKPGGRSIAFDILTLEVTQCHFCHIFLLKSGIKLYTVSRRGNIDSSFLGWRKVSVKSGKHLGWEMHCCGSIHKCVPGEVIVRIK